jgi:hypothetical protein
MSAYDTKRTSGPLGQATTLPVETNIPPVSWYRDAVTLN